MDPFLRFADADEPLHGWLAAVVATPGLTSLTDLAEARRVLVDDSLAGVELVRRFGGPVIDVGSGGGAPGIPLADALPDLEFTLLEASGRKCDFLREWAPPNVHVLQGRAEDQPLDRYKVALAKALAPPVVAAEWCLPLVAEGGAVVLWVGPSADRHRVAKAAEKIAAELVDSPAGFFLIRKLGPTPKGFPRRTGVARKRPLA